jgi:hypothetical protein
MAREKSGGMLMRHDGNGPIMRGLFELTRSDLKKLVDLAKANQEIKFNMVMWDKKVSSKGNEYWGLSIEEEREKQQPASNDPFGGASRTSSPFDGGPDDDIPFG